MTTCKIQNASDSDSETAEGDKEPVEDQNEPFGICNIYDYMISHL